MELDSTLIKPFVAGFHSVKNSDAATARTLPSKENAAAKMGLCLYDPTERHLQLTLEALRSYGTHILNSVSEQLTAICSTN
jgi:uncharacterized protein with von Willebrand factor type A (vWA) domain